MATVFDVGPLDEGSRKCNNIVDGLRGENRRLADELRRARARCGELVRLCTERGSCELGLCATDYEGIVHGANPEISLSRSPIELPKAQHVVDRLALFPEFPTRDVAGDLLISDRSAFDGSRQTLSREDLLDFWEGRCAELVREGEEREKQCAQLVAQCTRLIRCVREKEVECLELSKLCAKKDTEQDKALENCRMQEDRSEAAQMMIAAALKVEQGPRKIAWSAAGHAPELGTGLLSDIWEELMAHCEQVLKDCRTQERHCGELQHECRQKETHCDELQTECRQKDAQCAELARKCHEHEDKCIDLARRCRQLEASTGRGHSINNISPGSPSHRSFGLDSELSQAEFFGLQSACQRYEERWSETLKASGREEELCAVLRARLQREEDQCATYARDNQLDNKQCKMLEAEVQERGAMCARLESRIRKEKRENSLRRSSSLESDKGELGESKPFLRRSGSLESEKGDLGESKPDKTSRSVLTEELQERIAQCALLSEERGELKVRLNSFTQEIQDLEKYWRKECAEEAKEASAQRDAIEQYWRGEARKSEPQWPDADFQRRSASILEETQEALRIQQARAGDWEERFSQLEAAEGPKDRLWQSRLHSVQEAKEAQEARSSRVLEEVERHWRDRYAKVEAARRSWRERYLELKVAADAGRADAKSFQNEENHWSQCLVDLEKEELHWKKRCHEEVDLEQRWHDFYGRSEQQQLRLRDEVVEAEDQRDAKERQCAALQNDVIIAVTEQRRLSELIEENDSVERLVHAEREGRLCDQQEYEKKIQSLQAKLTVTETDCTEAVAREKELLMRIEELESHLSDKQRGVPQATAERASERAWRRSEKEGGQSKDGGRYRSPSSNTSLGGRGSSGSSPSNSGRNTPTWSPSNSRRDSPGESRRRTVSDGSLSPTRINRPPGGQGRNEPLSPTRINRPPGGQGRNAPSQGSRSMTVNSSRAPTPEIRSRGVSLDMQDSAPSFRGEVEASQLAPAHSVALERARRIMAARRKTSSLSRSPSPQRGCLA